MPTITIAGRQFEAPSRYSEGHTLTGNEASALNQLLAENLRNNFAPKVKALEEQHGKDLPAEASEALTSAFADYASAYEFGSRVSSGPRAPADPVEAEALKLMIEQVGNAIRKRGLKISAYKREDIVAKAKELLDRDDDASRRVYEVARTRVAEKQALVAEDFDALGGLEAAPQAESAPEAEVTKPKRGGRKAAQAEAQA